MLEQVKWCKTFLVDAMFSLNSSSPTDIFVLAIAELPTEFSSPTRSRPNIPIILTRLVSLRLLRLFEHASKDPYFWVGMSSLSCWDLLLLLSAKLAHQIKTESIRYSLPCFSDKMHPGRWSRTGSLMVQYVIYVVHTWLKSLRTISRFLLSCTVNSKMLNQLQEHLFITLWMNTIKSKQLLWRGKMSAPFRAHVYSNHTFTV